MAVKSKTKRKTHTAKSSAQTAMGDFVREALLRNPTASTRSLALLLTKKNPFLKFDNARQIVRYYRGELKNKPAVIIPQEKTVIKLPSPPKSLAEDMPIVQCDKGLYGVISDLHVPYHDDLAVKLAVKHLQRAKIDTLVINGDLVDFHTLSRFQKLSGKPDANGEIRQGNLMMRFLRSRFPHARIIYKIGNHDQRWQSWLMSKAPELYDICSNAWHEAMGSIDYDFEVVDDTTPIHLGKLRVWHGHEVFKGAFIPVNPAKTLYNKCKRHALTSHLHRASEHSEKQGDHTIVTYSIGCLSGLTPEYARENQFGHGFATVDVAKDQDFRVHVYKIEKGKVY